MKISLSITSKALVALSFVSVVKADYKLSDTIVGKGFYDAFNWLAIPDPTHGRVNYVDQSTAQSQNLTYASGNTFILRANFKDVVSGSSSGRNSVRIESKKRFTYHVTVYDVRHIPQGCGTWPAIWETDTRFYGEIDIVEGVNSEPQDAATFWTAPDGNCKQRVKQELDDPSSPIILKDCSEGCAVRPESRKSFGTAFNDNGGGWYAIERSPTFVKLWFWERNNAAVPADVKNGQSSVEPAGWGEPFFDMTNDNCDIDSNLKAHNLIINLTFCGAYAGSPQFENAGCPGTCQGFVDNTPGAFDKAYFDIAGIRVYQ
ncbi:2 beta-glucanase [Crepidotus variabilis]|uniref:2 beta-glucanase n=1 Tax=Crepidotus variabilis TaxID=179855 RepID=A0A9P6EAZ3_9AGAR|nr:2 beta-glucanase [Crepidotus variabilis]